MRKITQMIGRQKIALVFTNQLRVKLGVMFGDPYTTSGGKSITISRIYSCSFEEQRTDKRYKKNVIGMSI